MIWYNGTRCSDKDSCQVLIGSMLGDGSINRSGKNKTSPNYDEIHSPKQKEYLLWKNEFLKKILETKIVECSCYHKIRKKTYYRVRLLSKTNPLLLELYLLFYTNGKKHISKEALNSLAPLGLAVWYCDDGSYQYHNKTILLCTHCFSLDEQKLIKEYFLVKWDVCVEIKQRDKFHYIYINRDNSIKFLSIIKEYIPLSMIYKLGELHPLNKDKLEETRLKINSQKTKYRLKNRDKLQKYRKEYCNRPYVKLKIKERRDRNRSSINAYYRLYYKENIERIKVLRKKNHIKIKEQRLRYYNKNKDIVLHKHQKYYLKNREAILKKSKEFYKKNKDKKTTYNKSYYRKNRERLLEYGKIYSKMHYRRKRIK